jgi:hypothetical protein
MPSHDPDHMAKNKDLDPIRDRDDFTQLLAELAKKEPKSAK